MATIRQRGAAIARWGVAHASEFTYWENFGRMAAVSQPIFTLPIKTDCSGWATIVAKWAGAPDPNGLNFDGLGYTGTMVDHCTEIAKAEAQELDLVIYFVNGVSVHVGIIVVPGEDPLTVSDGEDGCPCLVHVSQDNRDPHYYRFLPPDPVAPPPKPAPKPAPSPEPNPAHPRPAGPLPVLRIDSPSLPGPWVAYLQTLLRLPVTGKFDVRTEQDVRQFQSQHHELANGIVDAATWALLGVR